MNIKSMVRTSAELAAVTIVGSLLSLTVLVLSLVAQDTQNQADKAVVTHQKAALK